MKKIFILIAFVASYSYSSAQTKPAAAKPKTATPAKPAATAQPKALSPIFKSQTDSASYAFGVSIANDIKSRGVSSLNSSLLAKAMNDVFAGSTPLLSPEKCQDLIMSFLGSVEKKKFEGNINEGTKFLSENSRKPGIVSLPSGLQYQVITPGTGAKPKATDEVTVNYKGTLLNGKQFDSSYDRGEPATFMLNQVIPGWTEGLQQMTTGSKYRFFIPYALAYGERAAGPEIAPYSTLIFEVELVSVQPR
ncbi:FKBP-type peptidyl-prolyl cis-trans isomerase [Daejeonella sp.]|uniref:FKBP-type peptidyl-prolyl cis-trans isomerase n=1 Tax=Daejeonella sp. TaxID=2805397 RepID=UPI0030C28BAD